MTKLLEILEDSEVTEARFERGEAIIREGSKFDKLYILKEGMVEVLRDRTPVCRICRRGSAFGELSALLDSSSTATVVARATCTFAVVEDPKALLERNHAATLEIARLLAQRVNRVTYDYIEEMDDGDSVFWESR